MPKSPRSGLDGARPGDRVSVRVRTPDGGATDLLGTLERWDGVRLAVRRDRTGEVVLASADGVLAARRVPPRRVRAAEVRALQDVMADGWQAVERAWLGGREGGWLLRAAEGFTGRANSALPLGDPGAPVAAAVDAVEAWYGARGLRPQVASAVPADSAFDGTAGEVEEELARRRWQVRTPSLVMVAPTAILAGEPALPDGLRLHVHDEPDEGWLSLYRYRGQPSPPVARVLLLSAPAQAFASVRDGAGTVLAVGRGTVSRGWAGVTAVEVAPSARRRGLAQAVLRGLAAWAAARGAPRTSLQVAEDNAAARALYVRAGFTVHHRYCYRAAPRS